MESRHERVDCSQISDINEDKIQKLREKYSTEMRDDELNPIKVCMKLIFQAAIEKDKNKRNELANELSAYLTKPDGIVNLFLTLIDFDVSSQKVTTHNQRFLAVANIIARLPKLCMLYSEYCSNICRQLKPLLIVDDPKYSSLSSIILKCLLESPHVCDKQKIADIIISPICQPFIVCGEASERHSLYNLSEAIIAIHNLIQNLFPTRKFVHLFPELFYCYIALRDSPSRLKNYIKVCLDTILNDLEQGSAVCLLEETVLYRNYLFSRYKCSASESEIIVELVSQSEESLNEQECEFEFEIIKNTVLQILEQSKNELLLLEYFFHFQAKVWTTNSDKQRLQCVSLIEPLLGNAAAASCEIPTTDQRGNLDLFSIILSNTDRATSLITRTLLNYIEYLRTAAPSTKEAKSLIGPSLDTCLTILEVLSVIPSRNNELMSSKLLPILLEIRQLLANESGDKLGKSLDSLIGKLSSSNAMNKDKAEQYRTSANGSFEIIIKDLNNDLVPVRVHALVRLKQLIMSNDAKTLEEIPRLYTLIESSLDDKESYVFLACINLVAEMSVRRTETMLPKLIDLYTNQELAIEQRLNVGEVLVRLTKQLNKTAPFYGGKILNTLILVSKEDPNEIVRISSLTNIGELCRFLGDSLGKWILDILASVEFALRSFNSIEVKCASVELLRTALMGVNKFTCESIQQELKSIYSLLKATKSRTLDDRLCLLSDLALDEIDRLAKELLGLLEVREQSEQSSKQLTKNIKLLRLFDDS